ncbi:DUF262 domain-containing protein, partial [Bacteroidales bacterium OttesenSCG-928-B11]|nr:DUF262 domain-containing protein [Bacteroidales bacterium OttesenSCG-928-B11]MDL2326472.1 DUF262 domain-containing protein [Bacteroidales bacterium OttesenSCG-928-A14]
KKLILQKCIIYMNINAKTKDTIELEEGNDDVITEMPFSPNDISISIIPRTIGQIVDMLRYGEIQIPAYQRLPDLWNEKKKSRFIESLMLGLPIPLFYFDEGADKKWRVIDGLQRISTLQHFINLCDAGQLKGCENITKENQPLVLKDLEFKTEFNGETWTGLPRDIQRRIETNQVTINLIGKGTPEEVKYNIFSRINQGSETLRAQEIRTAIFQGYRIQFVEKLVSSRTEAGRSFLKATDNSVPTNRQEDLDFATRFLSFYLIDFEKYEPDMDSFLTVGTKSIPKNKSEQERILADFKKAMKISYQIFGTNTFRKITSDNQRNRINKSLFELFSVYFARLNAEELNKLLKQKESFKEEFVLKLQYLPSFWAGITTGTATKDSVQKRHRLFKEFLNTYTQ